MPSLLLSFSAAGGAAAATSRPEPSPAHRPAVFRRGALWCLLTASQLGGQLGGQPRGPAESTCHDYIAERLSRVLQVAAVKFYNKPAELTSCQCLQYQSQPIYVRNVLQ